MLKKNLVELYNRGFTIVSGGYYLGPFNSLTETYRKTHNHVDEADRMGLIHDLRYSAIGNLIKDKKINNDEIYKIVRIYDNELTETLKKEFKISPWKSTVGFIGIKLKNILEDINLISPDLFIRYKVLVPCNCQIEDTESKLNELRKIDQ